MPEVFISYRQTSDNARQRVRAFGERLRAAGIHVILDQFFLEDKPGGPGEGWDKWSSDRALQTSHVIIIGSESWFHCFDKTQTPGTGLGAACEADDIRHRLHESNGIVETIRVVLFDDADSAYVSAKLKRYHRFHADRDLDSIVRWLCSAVPATGSPVSTLPQSKIGMASFRHNLPTVQRFFGREAELAKLLPDLDPDATGWGALIDGPGGMGKTSLAIRAAELAAPGHYDDIIFLSAKQTAIDPHGQYDESPFSVSGFTQMLDAIARRLQKPEFTRAPFNERPRLLIDALIGTRTLLILDNLETLSDSDQRNLIAFLQYLPRHCKALLTSRLDNFATGRRVKLLQLDQAAARQIIADIARDNPALASASEADRLRLIDETGGNTLLLTWAAWQVGSGYCATIADALAHLRSCPEGNDPLEFVFGDLFIRFTDEQERIVAVLSYALDPINLTAIAEISSVTETASRRALKFLTNRSIVVTQEGGGKYTLVPMVAEFLRHVQPELVSQMGNRLANRASRIIEENGRHMHARFPNLEEEWSSVAPALSVFLSGENSKLQDICKALEAFLYFQGRWDENARFCDAAEGKALLVGDFYNAGWRAYDVGFIHYLRKEANGVLTCAERARKHWKTSKAGPREQAVSLRLLGSGLTLVKDYGAAINAYLKSLESHRLIATISSDIAMGLNDLATVERYLGKFSDANKHLEEALIMAKATGYSEGEAYITGNMAAIALDLKDWPKAEHWAREVLPLNEAIHRKDMIGLYSFHLAQALFMQGKAFEASIHVQRAVDIFLDLRSPNLTKAQTLLSECESALDLA